jgi:hypothetical protein
MKQKTPGKQNIDEIINNCMLMINNVQNMREHSYSEKAIHYIGMNYELHIEELKKRNCKNTAEYFTQQWNLIGKK